MPVSRARVAVRTILRVVGDLCFADIPATCESRRRALRRSSEVVPEMSQFRAEVFRT
jgi:hypothetical protein